MVETRKAEELRHHSAGQSELLRDIDSMIAILNRRIDKLDSQIAQIIADTPELTEQARLLKAVPGIAPIVLATLLEELPELSMLNRRRIASLAGLAPHARENGTWKGAKDNPHRRGSTTARHHQCHDPKSPANKVMNKDTAAPQSHIALSASTLITSTVRVFARRTSPLDLNFEKVRDTVSIVRPR
ncbi:transposase [Nitratireductor aquibiodomus RA22]|uniref:Transposase n=1 Tax=Nitratireductor aquibiodomus RA22 TaxID=1189611 RepID=I5BWW1_9HYPH|nr:transposase [Nitratireductor aquibiodomus RA22]